jgi:hypothetical protein
MGKEGKQDMRRRRGKESAMEEDEAAPPTGCWIRLPRLGSGCMSSGSKVDSSTSGACGNGAGKNAPQLLLLHMAFLSLSAQFLALQRQPTPWLDFILDACLYV